MLLALWSVAGDDDISNLDTGHPISNTLHHSSSLMTKDTGEQTLGIMTIQGVDVSVAQSIANNL